MNAPELAGDTLYAVIDSLEAGVVLLDGERRILHWNRWLERRSGLASREVAGRRLEDVLPVIAGSRLDQAVSHAIRDRLPSLLSPALHGTLLPLYQTPDDRRRERRLQQLTHVIAPLRAGAVACMIQISDVTANISRERQLRQQTDSLRRSWTQDALTGLANRRAFDEALDREFAQARQSEQSIGLLIADLDHFTDYNARYGREQGDAALRRIAATLTDGWVDAGDLIARHGGQAFAVLLPGAGRADVCRLASQLRDRIARLGISFAGSPLADHLTVSIGTTAMHPTTEADTHTLRSSADVALFQAKHDGRDRAVFFSAADGSFQPCC